MDKITQADRHRAERFNCDLRCGMTGTQVHNLAGAFARHRLAHTQQSDTPVAWMYYAEDGQEATQPLKNRLVPNTMGWTETPLYTHPPATDVAALVEAAKALVQQVGLQNTRVYRTDPAMQSLIAALAPFTKGQP